jgi:hypothetical protein
MTCKGRCRCKGQNQEVAAENGTRKEQKNQPTHSCFVFSKGTDWLTVGSCCAIWCCSGASTCPESSQFTSEVCIIWQPLIKSQKREGWCLFNDDVSSSIMNNEHHRLSIIMSSSWIMKNSRNIPSHPVLWRLSWLLCVLPRGTVELQQEMDVIGCAPKGQNLEFWNLILKETFFKKDRKDIFFRFSVPNLWSVSFLGVITKSKSDQAAGCAPKVLITTTPQEDNDLASSYSSKTGRINLQEWFG